MYTVEDDTFHQIFPRYATYATPHWFIVNISKISEMECPTRLVHTGIPLSKFPWHEQPCRFLYGPDLRAEYVYFYDYDVWVLQQTLPSSDWIKSWPFIFFLSTDFYFYILHIWFSFSLNKHYVFISSLIFSSSYWHEHTHGNYYRKFSGLDVLGF